MGKTFKNSQVSLTQLARIVTVLNVAPLYVRTPLVYTTVAKLRLKLSHLANHNKLKQCNKPIRTREQRGAGTCCQAQEGMKLLPSAGNRSIAARQTGQCRQERENKTLLPSAVTRATATKRGKNVQLLPSTGKPNKFWVCS